MKILITGGGGMLGAKLIAHLVANPVLNGQKITLIERHDVVLPPPPPPSSFSITTQISDFSEPGEAEMLLASRPDVIFHLAAIVSGEAEADLAKGYRINLDGTRRLFEAIIAIGGEYKPRVVFTSSIAVFGAPFPDAIGDDFALAPPHQLRYPEGNRRTLAGRLFTPRILRWCRHPHANRLCPSGKTQQGRLRLLLRHHPRTLERHGSNSPRQR